MKTKRLRRALGMILAAVMIFTLVPAAAMAADDDGAESDLSNSSGEMTANVGSSGEDGQIPGNVGAPAKENYALWIRGVQVTSDTLSGDGWTYDPETKTLTLDGINIYEYFTSIDTGINADIDGLTINLEGTNKMSGTINVGIVNGEGKTLNFEGVGSLNIDAGTGIENNGGTINVNGGDIVISVTGNGVTNKSGIINVNDGSLRLYSSRGDGIKNSSGNITINGGTFYASSGLEKAIDESGTVSYNEKNVELIDPGDGGLYENNGKSWIVDGNGKIPREIEIDSMEVKYDLWVNNEQVTSRNLDGDGWIYNSRTKTLTLNGAYITEGRQYWGSDPYYAGIYTKIDGMTIILKNSNTIDMTAAESGKYMFGIVNSAKTLIIDGDGSLNIEGKAAGIYNYNAKTLRIDGGTVNINSSGSAISNNAGTIIVNGGIVNTKSYSIGVSNSYTSVISIKSGSLSAESEKSNAIIAGSLNVTGGTFYAKGGITDAGEEKEALRSVSVTYDKKTMAITKPENGILKSDSIYDSEDNAANEVEIKTVEIVPSEPIIDYPPKEEEPENEHPHGKSYGGGKSGTAKYTLTYDTNGGSQISPEIYEAGGNVNLDKVPEKANFIFTGWYSDKELTNKITSIQMNSAKTVYAGWEDITSEAPESPETAEEAPLMKIVIGNTQYKLKGEDMEMDAAPFIDVNDRTMLPVRVITNALGISDEEISWDDDTKTATFIRPDTKTVSCTVGVNVIWIGDEKFEIDTAPIIASERIFLPMRALFNAFNVSDGHILWDGAEKTVTLSKEAAEDINALNNESFWVKK